MTEKDNYELERQIAKYTRRVNPRPRAEIDRAFEEERTASGPLVERYNTLLERQNRTWAELRRLKPSIRAYEDRAFELREEYAERARLDGVLPSLPRVIRPAGTDHKNDVVEEGEDDGRDEHDFEVGSKG